MGTTGRHLGQHHAYEVVATHLETELETEQEQEEEQEEEQEQEEEGEEEETSRPSWSPPEEGRNLSALAWSHSAGLRPANTSWGQA